MIREDIKNSKIRNENNVKLSPFTFPIASSFTIRPIPPIMTILPISNTFNNLSNLANWSYYIRSTEGKTIIINSLHLLHLDSLRTHNSLPRQLPIHIILHLLVQWFLHIRHKSRRKRPRRREKVEGRDKWVLHHRLFGLDYLWLTIFTNWLQRTLIFYSRISLLFYNWNHPSILFHVLGY